MKQKLLHLCFAICLLSCLVGCSEKSLDEPVINQEPTVMPEYDLSLPDNVKAVDLGLAVKWASCNLGAKESLDYGGYFAWGDPTGKLWSGEGIGYDAQGYTWDTELYGGKKPRTIEFSGSMLDIVAEHWGNGWRTPTMTEAWELCRWCEWELKEKNGRKFYRVTGQNGNYIDLPLGGVYGDFHSDSPYRFSKGPNSLNIVGMYWTSTVCLPGEDVIGGRGYYIHKDVYTAYAFAANSNLGDITGKSKILSYLRAMHMSIRPVRSKGSAPPG